MIDCLFFSEIKWNSWLSISDSQMFQNWNHSTSWEGGYALLSKPAGTKRIFEHIHTSFYNQVIKVNKFRLFKKTTGLSLYHCVR